MLTSVVNEITAVTDTPLQIDSSSPSAIEAALRAYPGKAVVNSVNGEKKSMKNILPIVKKYGAAVVILTLDENGIPKKAQQRFEIAERVINKALDMGIKKSDLFVDCLTLTVSAQQEDAGVKAEYKRNLSCPGAFCRSRPSYYQSKCRGHDATGDMP